MKTKELKSFSYTKDGKKIIVPSHKKSYHTRDYKGLLLTIKKISLTYSEKTKTFEKNWWKSDLGYCPVASYNLSLYFKGMKIKTKVIHGEFGWLDDHYWVEVVINNRLYWIDPTHYQFESGGLLFGSPVKFIKQGYKVNYKCNPEEMEIKRKYLFMPYSGGRDNPKYKV